MSKQPDYIIKSKQSKKLTLHKSSLKTVSIAKSLPTSGIELTQPYQQRYYNILDRQFWGIPVSDCLFINHKARPN